MGVANNMPLPPYEKLIITYDSYQDPYAGSQDKH